MPARAITPSLRKLVRVAVFESASPATAAPQLLDEVLVEPRAAEIVVQRLKLNRPVRQEHPFDTAAGSVTGLDPPIVVEGDAGDNGTGRNAHDIRGDKACRPDVPEGDAAGSVEEQGRENEISGPDARGAEPIHPALKGLHAEHGEPRARDRREAEPADDATIAVVA
jgi:hypothetical protein